MPFSDLIRAEVTVESKKGPFVCRRPTLATIWKLYQHYGAEIKSAMSAGTLQEIIDPAMAESLITDLMLARHEDARAVLSTCVEPLPDSEADIRKCLQSVLSTTDVLRIARVLSFDGSPGERARRPDSKSDSHVNITVEVARFLSADPIAVANEWPYEAVLTILDDMADRAMEESGEKTFSALPDKPIGPGLGSARVVNKRPLVN